MKIFIEDLSFKSIVGILDFERKKKQPVVLNITIEYSYSDAAFINYADVAKYVKKRFKKQKYLLLEDALSDLSKKLKEKFSTIEKLSIKITKPSILPDCRVSLQEEYSFES